jgi:DNA helicase HerA-like ATPase
VYEYRKRHAVREAFTHALFIEEAHHILSAGKERAAGAETIMETCLRQIREFGEAVIILDQEPSKLSHAIRANTATQISLALGTGSDVVSLAGPLGLDVDAAPWLYRLPIGHGIVAVRPRLAVPVLVGFPAVAIRKGFVDDVHLVRS